MDRPIKSLGVHDVRIALHPEVTVTVKVNVARSPEEAEIQARGGTILDEDEDTEDETAAEEVAAEAADAPDDAATAAAEDAPAAGDEAGEGPDEPEDEGSPST